MYNLLFQTYTLYMNYVTKTILLVSSSVTGKQLLGSVHGKGQETEEQRHTTKTFVEFDNHFPIPSVKCASKVWQMYQ